MNHSLGFLFLSKLRSHAFDLLVKLTDIESSSQTEEVTEEDQDISPTNCGS